MQPTADGQFITGGNMMENEGNRLAIVDPVTGKSSRTIKNIEFAQDAIMVGKDVYYAGGLTKNWPKAPEIIRITPDDKRETVLKGKNWKAFAPTTMLPSSVTRMRASRCSRVGSGWMKPAEGDCQGLKGPQGMTLGIHGDLIVMEKNSDPYNGRMLSIDLKTEEITVLADALGVDPSVEKRNWKVLKPHSTVAQTLDGTIYFTEPGATSFSVLRPQN